MPKNEKNKLDISSLEWLITDLNEPQRDAVQNTEGPVLILAGAGSGKTRVLTYRIAYILANGLAAPNEILSMTFTNKAAGEMRERISALVPDMVSGMWIGTFHSLFARMLRIEGERLGYGRNFAIYDEADQSSLLKTVYNELGFQVTDVPLKQAAHRISYAKNNLITPDGMAATADNPLDDKIARIYKRYQSMLMDQNAMDFDDLLVKPIELFENFPLVKQYYQDKFRYILVDEYQDTNHAQYIALRMLAQKHKNICVVGDDDQSIYRWRGADLRNILDFEHDYPRCKKYRLEQNYRSTKNILAAAHSVVKNNIHRHDKQLWTDKEEGALVSLLCVNDEQEEAQYIVDRISQELRASEKGFYDFAILYRTNAQSRSLEEALRSEGIPYIIVGGVKFYERKEVKDVLAYLRILSNPADGIAIRRVINYPSRGIGETTISKIEAYARDKKMTFYDAMADIQHVGNIAVRTAEKVRGFWEMMEKYRQMMSEFSIAELASMLVDEIGILKLFKEEGTIESISRGDNVRELLHAIAEFSNKNENPTLDGFLEHVSLVTDIDNWDDRSNAVTLMTLHSAKGLEFSVVFIAGLEEGLFPLSRSIDDPHALEEERRLFYVGATRAKEKLYLVWAKNRRRFGERIGGVQSRFLKELDSKYVDHEYSRTILGYQRKKQPSIWQQDSMPDYENESQEDVKLRVGMRVSHKMFGRGTVLKIINQVGNIKVNVLFDNVGEKRLVLPYAKLEIL